MYSFSWRLYYFLTALYLSEQYMYDFVEEPSLEIPKPQVSEEKPQIKSIPGIEHPVLHLSNSVSTPSLTDYVRKHLMDLHVGSGLGDLAAIAQPGCNKASNSDDQPHFRSHGTSTSIWQPRFGSPKYVRLPSVGNGTGQVSFFIGANEDDMDTNATLWNDVENLNELKITMSESRHCHFSSHVQRNSTMPDLSAVSCS